VLGFRRVDLNAFVLSTIFSLEIAIILVLDVAILADKGLGAFTLQAFNPSVIFSGAPGVALTFAFGTFIGFEATAIFAEETKNPKKTVPRATYIAVALVGTFFAISSWALIAGVGADRVQAVAAEDPGSFSFAAMQTYVGSFGYHAMNILMVTSLFGTALGLHNAGARYLFALSRDGVMPRQLSRTHPAHNSPWLASVSQLAFVSIVVAIFALAGADPFLVMATSFAGVGILGILALQTMVGFAVIAFFWRHAERHWFRTVVAPLLGSAAMIGASVLIVINYALVGQTSSQILNKAPWILIVTAIGGAAYATLLKVNRPDKYAAVSAALVTDSLDEDLDAFASGETSRERPGAPGRGHAIPVQQE
jgi:amino acid transporter